MGKKLVKLKIGDLGDKAREVDRKSCFRCGLKGHIRAQCKKKMRDRSPISANTGPHNRKIHQPYAFSRPNTNQNSQTKADTWSHKENNPTPAASPVPSISGEPAPKPVKKTGEVSDPTTTKIPLSRQTLNLTTTRKPTQPGLNLN